MIKKCLMASYATSIVLEEVRLRLRRRERSVVPDRVATRLDVFGHLPKVAQVSHLTKPTGSILSCKQHPTIT